MRCAFILFITLSCNAHAYSNEPDGFRGISWGDDLELNQAEMTLLETSDLASFYTRDSDSMEIGGANISKITYRYVNNKFSASTISTEGASNQSALIDAFKAQFGRPYQANRYIDTFIWNGNKTTIILSCKRIRYSCYAIMNSTKNMNDEKAMQKQKALDATKDF